MNLHQKMVMVVARYNEDLAWLKHVPWNYIVLNKGSELPNWINNEIKLPNRGREAHSYLTYLVNNYESLPEYTVFVQGNPFQHAKKLIQKITNFSGNADFFALSDTTLHADGWGNPNHPGLKVTESADKIFLETLTSFEFSKGAQFIVSKKVVLFHTKMTYQIIVSFMLEGQANTAVCRIRKHKKNCECMKPFSPWVLERLWKILFDHEHKTKYD